MSLEEQRQRQEEEARRVQQESLEQMQTEQGERTHVTTTMVAGDEVAFYVVIS